MTLYQTNDKNQTPNKTFNNLVLTLGDGLLIQDAGTANNTSASGAFTLINVENGGTANGTTLSGKGHEIVESGGIDNNAIVNISGLLEVDGGGKAFNPIINSGGMLLVEGTVKNGSGVVSGATISAGAIEFVNVLGIDHGAFIYGSQNVQRGNSPGVAHNATVFAGGDQFVSGTASGTVLSGGSQTVWGLGVATDTEVFNGGTQSIQSGGSAIDSIVHSGGTLKIFNSGSQVVGGTFEAGANFHVGTGAIFNKNTIDGGNLTVSAGGDAEFITLTNSATETILSGGLDAGAFIESGSTQNVESGGVANFTQVDDHGHQNVKFGGVATSATLSGGDPQGGGEQNVFGTANFTMVLSGGTQNVFSGGVTSGTTIGEDNSAQEVMSGGKAFSTIVENDGYQAISAGGIASNTTINSGGLQDVNSGGNAIATIVNSGGEETVHSGGTISGSIIKDGGTLELFGGAIASFSGNAATKTVLSAGSILEIISAYSLNGFAVVSGSELHVLDDATARASTVSSGGIETIAADGLDISATIFGTQTIESGGTASATLVNSGGIQVVLGDAIAISATVASGGFQEVGGTASGTILNGGDQVVESGGTAENAVINKDGDQTVSSGGVISGASVNSGGVQHVESGGTAHDTIVNSDGIQNVSGEAEDTTVNNGGKQVVDTDGTASATTINSGGVEVVSGGTTIDTIINGGTLELGAGATVVGTITFAATGGTLKDDDTTMATNTITGFGIGDIFDLAAVPFDSINGQVQMVGNVLQIVENGNTYQFTLDSDPTSPGISFQLLSDSKGGTNVQLVAANPLTLASAPTSVPAAGAHLGVGQDVNITLNLTEAAIVNGKPTISLNDGGTAIYLSGSGTNALVFQYTVAAGENTNDLKITTVNTSAKNTVKDAAGNTADFSGAQNADLGIVIDALAPTITNVSGTPSTGAVGIGQTVVINVAASEAVTVVGTPTLALNDKGIATYDAINSTATDLKFNYTPTVGQNTADLQVSALVLGKGSTIKDLAGNALNLTGAKADLQLVVDTIAPIVKGALKSDTGISATDKFTTDATLTGSGDPNATVNFTGDVVGNTVANSAGVWTFSPGVLADGAHSITATETDAAGNVGSTTLQFTLDSKAPTVTGSLASPTSIGTGGTATITVNLGEAISVVGTPTLILSDGETATYSAAASKLAAGALAFTLKAAAGTNQSDLSIDHVNLAAGVTVKDLAGNAADFSKAAGADLSLSIDTVAPTITSVTTPSTGAVGIGQTVEIDILTSEAVNVVGTPTLALNDKGIATYDAINSTATDLKFNYTPTVGQNTVDLQVSALVLGKGSTIKDLAGNLLNPAGAAKADLGLVVDTLAPAVTKVAVLPASGALTAGNDVTITLTLNDKATVTSNPVLTLNDGATADYVSGSGSNTLVFNYHVGSESTTDLKITGINQSGGTIADAVGNLISSALLFDTKLTANVFTWTHTAAPGGDWNTGANWLPASVPVAGNTALITSKGTYTVTSNQDNSIGTLSLTNKTATLDVQGFEFDITGSSTNAGTIQIDNGAKLGLAGTFTNTGSVLLNSTGSATGLLISGATILAGTGKFTLSDNIGNGIFADGSPATLTNISNTIAGAGQIFDNDLSIDNQAKGIINAVGTSSLTIDVDTFTNAGTLKATGTGGLVIHDTTIANVGKGLVATLAANSHIDLDDADITGGTVTIFKNSSIDTINDHDSTISATKFTNAGAVMADHGDLTVTGAIANTGLLAAAHDSTLSFTGAVTGKGIAQISSGGTLEFQGASSALVTFLDGTGTLELDNATNSVAKFTGTVTGFANGTDIELGAIDFTTGNAQLSFNAGKLTVTDGTHSETLTFIGSYTLADFNAVNVGGHVDLLHV